MKIRWPFKHNCPMCERLKDENAYLKGLVNSLLVKQEIPIVVTPTKPKELSKEEKERQDKIAKGELEEYGD
ncbi:MAG: hypothetical protein WC738_04295 [Candidatus Omnitrophota bacterium]